MEEVAEVTVGTNGRNQGVGEPADRDAVMVGARIRNRRQHKGVRLIDVAEQVGLSESYLSQLERGRTQGSIAALKRITDVLGMTMSELFEPDLSEQPRLMRASDRQYVDLAEGTRKTMLTSRPMRYLEVFLADFPPGGSTGPEAYSHGESEEFLFVVSGKVLLELGDEKHELDAGDCIVYQSSIAHRLSNPYEDDAQVTWSISPPSY